MISFSSWYKDAPVVSMSLLFLGTGKSNSGPGLKYTGSLTNTVFLVKYSGINNDVYAGLLS